MRLEARCQGEKLTPFVILEFYRLNEKNSQQDV